VPPVVADDQVLDIEDGFAGLRRSLVDDQLHVSTDHHRGQRLLVGLVRRGVAHHLAVAEHADLVGDAEHLPQLVTDEDDRAIALGQLADDLHQFGDLGRREHRRRLVEDEAAGVAVQGLEDLDPLLDAHGEVLDGGLGVDRQPETLGQFLHPPVRLGAFEPAERPGGLDA
jgi:hypothetical protein